MLAMKAGWRRNELQNIYIITTDLSSDTEDLGVSLANCIIHARNLHQLLRRQALLLLLGRRDGCGHGSCVVGDQDLADRTNSKHRSR
jgi:hypothetical protein